jgi:hypothetical protein
MSTPKEVNVTYQTTQIVITMPIRESGQALQPNVSATRTRVLLNEDGTVFGQGPSETRILPNVEQDPDYDIVMAAFARNIDAAFTDQPSIVTQ